MKNKSRAIEILRNHFGPELAEELADSLDLGFLSENPTSVIWRDCEGRKFRADYDFREKALDTAMELAVNADREVHVIDGEGNIVTLRKAIL